VSRTSIEVSLDPRDHRSRVRLGSSGPDGLGHLTARMLGPGHGSARVALIAEGALLLADDVIEIDVSVGPDAALDLVEPSGTVAYDMRGGSAQWRVRVHLAERARLRWHGKPFVVAEGADVSRRVQVDLESGATAMLRETLVLGRSGERGGSLAQHTRVTHADHPLLVEDLLLDKHRPRTGLLGPWRVVDTVSVFGRRADDDAQPGTPEADAPKAGTPKAGTFTTAPPEAVTGGGARRFELEGPGTLIRSLSGQAHAGCLEPLWRVVAKEWDQCSEGAVVSGVDARVSGATA
jgi:urease accessory protein